MFAHVARRLDHHDYLLDTFSVADCYLFWVLFVAPHGGLSLNAHQGLRRADPRPTERDGRTRDRGPALHRGGGGRYRAGVAPRDDLIALYSASAL